jgi:hypothetical protein
MAGVLYCLGLLIVSGALAWALSTGSTGMTPNEVKAEVVKIGLQVVVFGLAGGGVKLLLDRQGELRAFRTDMLDRLGTAHKDVYRIRRLLGLNPDDTAELLGELMDARQDLGAAYHTARIGGFSRRIVQVRAETDGMRAYLEGVIVGALAADDTPERAAYTAFLDWRRGSEAYDTEFKHRYFRAKGLIDPSFRTAAGTGRA